MAIAFVQAKVGASGGAVASQAVALTSAPTAGNTLIAIVACDTTGRTFTITSTNATWTSPAHKIQTSTSGDAHQFSTTAVAASAGTTVTATINTGTAFLTVAVYEFSGLVTGATSFDVSSGASNVTGAGGNAPTAGTTATTSQANEVVIGGWLFNNGLNITFTAGGSFTAPAAGQNLTGTSNLCLLSEYLIVAATGTQTATGTTNDSNGRWAGTIGTYKMAATGGAASNLPVSPLRPYMHLLVR